MPYDELDNCLEPGQEPFWGPVTWLMAAGGISGGLFVGLPLAAVLGLNSAAGFLFGALLGLALVTRFRGVAVIKRLMLRVRHGTLRRVVDVGDVDTAQAARYQLQRVHKGRPITILKRGRL
jgi:hypothetical protein